MTDIMREYENSRPIPGIEEYRVSPNGVVFSKSGNPMAQHKNTKGYMMVRLYFGGRKHRVSVHRCVGKAFIPNPNNLYCINHKDENKTNNRVENLEWCTLAYNLGYGTKPMKTGIANQKNKGHKVIHSVNGVETFYPSINAASKETGVCRPVITKQCKTTGEWRYAI